MKGAGPGRAYASHLVITPADYLRIVLDPRRLAILGRASIGPVDVPALAVELGVPPRSLLKEAGSLRQAGLLREDLSLDRDALRMIGESLPALEPVDPSVLQGTWTAEEIEVLARFFEGSRLREIPAARGKRRVVLERLVQEFEPGLRYEERRVNAMLQVFHEDYAALRRYLVDEGFLTRAEGVYWRSGGRYDPPHA